MAQADDLALLITHDKGMEVSLRSHDTRPGVLVLILGQFGFVEFQVLAPDFGPLRIVAVVEKADAHDGVVLGTAGSPLNGISERITIRG